MHNGSNDAVGLAGGGGRRLHRSTRLAGRGVRRLGAGIRARLEERAGANDHSQCYQGNRRPFHDRFSFARYAIYYGFASRDRFLTKNIFPIRLGENNFTLEFLRREKL